MAGEWIPEKARRLAGEMFPGQWAELADGTLQGECPGAHLHTGRSAKTDCRIHVSYGTAGQSPGIYCLHGSCKGVLEDLNKAFRDALFAKDGDWKPSAGEAANAGVVRQAPRPREGWIPEFNISKLRGMVQAVPVVSEAWFMERSPVDPRRIGPGEFLELAFRPGERVMVFTEFKGPGDFLWEVGKGGYRLGSQRGVKAVRSKLPVDGGQDGVWFLSNPVDGKWYPNPRREGIYSRRSMESVTGWRHLVLECDEEKALKRMAGALREAAAVTKGHREIFKKWRMQPKWMDEVMAFKPRETWLPWAEQLEREAAEVPGLWMRFLAMAPVAIKAIYSSGGASLHALVVVDMKDKASFDTFLRQSAKRIYPMIGADPAAMTPVRLTRLPGCTRGGRQQKLIYLNPNPSPDGVPIRDLVHVRGV